MAVSPIKFFSWQVGQRVSRKDTQERGTVVQTMPRLKVKWDGGQTSEFRRNHAGNVIKLRDEAMPLEKPEA